MRFLLTAFPTGRPIDIPSRDDLPADRAILIPIGPSQLREDRSRMSLNDPLPPILFALGWGNLFFVSSP